MLSPRFIPQSVFCTQSVVRSPQSVFYTDRFPNAFHGKQFSTVSIENTAGEKNNKPSYNIVFDLDIVIARLVR